MRGNWVERDRLSRSHVTFVIAKGNPDRTGPDHQVLFTSTRIRIILSYLIDQCACMVSFSQMEGSEHRINGINCGIHKKNYLILSQGSAPGPNSDPSHGGPSSTALFPTFSMCAPSFPSLIRLNISQLLRKMGYIIPQRAPTVAKSLLLPDHDHLLSGHHPPSARWHR